MLYRSEKLGSRGALPSKEQVIEGMYQHFTGLVNNDCKGIHRLAIEGIIKGFRNIYDLLYQCLTDTDFKSPIDFKELWNPNSPFTQIMYYMYSLEPPIYYYLNQAMRKMDTTKLDTLGPYACVMFRMLNLGTFCDKKRVDKMRVGE